MPLPRFLSLSLLLIALPMGCSVGTTNRPTTEIAQWVAPSTHTGADSDDYHGTVVADPYRWLEDQDGSDVAAWVAEQNAVTTHILDAVPQRDAIQNRLTELWNYERYSAPTKAGSQWFFSKNNGLQNQSILYVASSPNSAGEVLLDPNQLSDDGTVALAGVAIDEQGKRMAYATSKSGSDWRTWHVLDVATGKTLSDVITWSKFSGASWTHDGAGFFYQRYPAPEEGETYQAQNRQPQLCYHRVGTDQKEDKVVYERPDQTEWGFGPRVTDDGRFLVISISTGTDQRNRVAYADLQEEGWPVKPLLMDFDATYSFLGNQGDSLFFSTNKNAPQQRIIAVDRNNPAADAWRELVPEQAHRLDSVRLVADQFVCGYLADASSQVLLFDLDGKPHGSIELPTLGTARGFTGKLASDETFFTFSSFTQPPAILRYDFSTKTLSTFRRPSFPRDDSDLITKRVFLQSKDGTRLCMFLVHKEGLPLDGSMPCYLYGYGGFDISLPPRFSVPNLVWVDRGGLYVQAILRGGGEYGEEWHRAGMLENKQNVFDDFIACAEYLVRNGYTSRERLAVGGRSNGGLLAAAVLTQRPDLMGAAIPEVGVLDMLRYHQFTIGWAWAPEYGRSDDPTQFDFLYRYSPLHNIHAGTHYPPTLIMTGDHDDRVLPGHSYKFAAALQAAQGGLAPILLRVETDAGHGAGTPITKLIEVATDRWAFLEMALNGN